MAFVGRVHWTIIILQTDFGAVEYFQVEKRVPYLVHSALGSSVRGINVLSMCAFPDSDRIIFLGLRIDYRTHVSCAEKSSRYM